jgi:hypothetical protein
MMGTIKDTKSIKDKDIFALSIGAVLYFGFLLSNAMYFKLESTAINVIQELFTIPIIVGQLVFFILAGIRFRQNKYSIKTLTFVSMIILAASQSAYFQTSGKLKRILGN